MSEDLKQRKSYILDAKRLRRKSLPPIPGLCDRRREEDINPDDMNHPERDPVLIFTD